MPPLRGFGGPPSSGPSGPPPGGPQAGKKNKLKPIPQNTRGLADAVLRSQNGEAKDPKVVAMSTLYSKMAKKKDGDGYEKGKFLKEIAPDDWDEVPANMFLCEF